MYVSTELLCMIDGQTKRVGTRHAGVDSGIYSFSICRNIVFIKKSLHSVISFSFCRKYFQCMSSPQLGIVGTKSFRFSLMLNFVGIKTCHRFHTTFSHCNEIKLGFVSS